MTLRSIYYLLSPRMRRIVRRIYYLPTDCLDYLLGNKSPLVPTKGKIFIGPGDYINIGDTFLKNFIAHCELKPNDKVLDIGCGIGRIARPLATYLSSEGTYEGFDIVREGIEWCKKAYRAYPNFNFTHTPLRNDLYNLSTLKEASTFIFPYKDEQFDLIILTSVFTHMQENDLKNYIHEIARVLKKGKFCFCSFFLLTKESEEFISKEEKPFFKYKFENYFRHDEKVKDANIAYQFDFIESIIRDNSLKINTYYPGWWAGRKKEECLNFQDILIISKQK